MSMIDEATLVKIRAELASTDPGLRAQAAEALAELDDGKGIVLCLASGDAHVRRMGIRGLARQAGERPTWRIAQMRFDRDPSVRSAVAQALGHREGRIAAHALRRMVEQDESANVRFYALVGLAEGHASRAEATLRFAAEEDPEPRVRDTAAAFLRRRAAR
jgi:HEAT repeat protein